MSGSSVLGKIADLDRPPNFAADAASQADAEGDTYSETCNRLETGCASGDALLLIGSAEGKSSYSSALSTYELRKLWIRRTGRWHQSEPQPLPNPDIAVGLTRAERIKLVESRQCRYRCGVVDTVWKNARQPDGKVYDPNTLQELKWDKSKTRDGQWDMGHRPGRSYEQLKQQFINGEISRDEFLNEYKNSGNYRPESAPPNRSRRYDKSNETRSSSIG